MEKGIIYEFRNVINDQYYVGQTIYPEKRYYEHSVAKGDSLFHRAINQYGFDKFEYSVVGEYEASTPYELKQILNEAEIKQIEKRNSFYEGYNVTLGGDSLCGYKMSEESKQKNRESNIRAWAEGRNKGTTGNKEFGKHISEIQTGRKLSEETKRKISSKALERDYSYLMGHEVSEETRKKISEANKGKPGPWKGKHLSEEHKQKLSVAKKGKKKRCREDGSYYYV